MEVNNMGKNDNWGLKLGKKPSRKLPVCEGERLRTDRLPAYYGERCLVKQVKAEKARQRFAD